MNDFQEKLKEVLALYEKTGSLETTIKTFRLTANQKKRLQEAFAYLDRIADNDKDLREAKDNGVVRNAWLTEKVVETAESKGLTSEQTEMMVGDIMEASNKLLTRKAEED